MYHQNPYFSWTSGPQSPSVFGAVPYSTPQAVDVDMITFQLTQFSPDIFNCTVVDSRKRPVYQFVTDRHNPGYTALKNVGSGKNVALIEWQTPPQIEIRGVVSKQRAKDWLMLSSNKTSRKMDVERYRYMWVPQDTSITLYSGGASTKRHARIGRTQSTIVLDISTEAMDLGLLEPCLVATLLMQSGRNIE